MEAGGVYPPSTKENTPDEDPRYAAFALIRPPPAGRHVPWRRGADPRQALLQRQDRRLGALVAPRQERHRSAVVSAGGEGAAHRLGVDIATGPTVDI